MTLLSVEVPVIETERLVLREPRMSDLEAQIAFGTDPERMRYIGGARTRHDAWRGFLVVAGHWVLRGYGYWTIEEKATGALVGRTGVHMHDGEWPEPELGWGLYRGFDGKSYAYEAALAARQQAAKMGLGPLISLINPENARSRQLAERLGAVIESEKVVLGEPALIYRHPTVEVAA